ncbi:MAG: cytochrome c oxidase subunit II [Burkholderiaceae bacterium]|nr:cytochrome c oxidase subunit II [Burkholderiaceae bacterium]
MPGHRGTAEDRFGRAAHSRILPRIRIGALAPASLAALCACGGPQSTLDPAGPSAAAIALVWWWMAGAAALVTTAVIAIWLAAMRRHGLPVDAAQRSGRRWIVGGGIVLPLLAIVALLVFGAPAGRHHLPWPEAAGSPPPLRVDAIGRQWSWELHYPDSGVRLRNELRLPVGRPVHVHTQSRDVIHSFWVPSLGGKLDALPGRTLVMRLQADRPGSWRGQCAEFCGLGHAHMSMTVLAMEPAAFDAWLATQRPARGESR